MTQGTHEKNSSIEQCRCDWQEVTQEGVIVHDSTSIKRIIGTYCFGRNKQQIKNNRMLYWRFTQLGHEPSTGRRCLARLWEISMQLP